jgi:hypothetical protein
MTHPLRSAIERLAASPVAAPQPDTGHSGSSLTQGAETNKTPVDFNTLRRLAEIARINGTQEAFIDVALQWASQAHAAFAASLEQGGGELDAFVKRLRAHADREYCLGIRMAHRDEHCLGWEAKAAGGKFGQPEHDAHKKMNRHLGAHYGIYTAINSAQSAPKADTEDVGSSVRVSDEEAKDAARYRAMKARRVEFYFPEPVRFVCASQWEIEVHNVSATEIDAALDAAMLAGQGEKSD